MNKYRNIFAVLFFLYIQQIQLSYSAAVEIKNNLTMALPLVFLNIVLVGIPFLILLFILRKTKWAVLAASILMTVLSIVNYHIVLFHGSPFLAGDIYSFKTALNVASEYTPVFDSVVIKLFALFAVELTIWYAVFCLRKTDDRETFGRKKTGILLATVVLLITVLFFSPIAVFDSTLISWSWLPAMNQYGYGVCFVNSISSIMNYCSEPENYNAEAIICNTSERFEQVEQNALPDIILILNESLTDLDCYMEQEESRKIFQKLRFVNGLTCGYTVSSLIGGGTNNSEYELLTSNSMQMLNGSAPFYSLSLENATSIISYLKEFGYVTAGMHCSDKMNYNRDRAYRDIGFDEIRLGWSAFQYQGANGNRACLDSDNYKDMIALYESCGDNPRFIYLLTLQNHGGYQQNDACDDTVFVKADYGEYTDDINEYLTSVEKSVDAFVDLIRYFEKVDRKTVIMMVGDHAPAFIADVPTNRILTEEEKDLAQRMVPYYVWSNQEIDVGVIPKFASMVDLVPILLRSVNMPLTGYYKTIIELNERVPIRTSTNLYMDAEGKIGRYIPNEPYYDIIQNYYFLEYNNLVKGNDYNPEWFELRK